MFRYRFADWASIIHPHSAPAAAPAPQNEPSGEAGSSSYDRDRAASRRAMPDLPPMPTPAPDPAAASRRLASCTATTIETLPGELATLVFGSLTARAVGNCLRVSKLLRARLLSDGELWERLLREHGFKALDGLDPVASFLQPIRIWSRCADARVCGCAGARRDGRVWWRPTNPSLAVCCAGLSSIRWYIREQAGGQCGVPATATASELAPAALLVRSPPHPQIPLRAPLRPRRARSRGAIGTARRGSAG